MANHKLGSGECTLLQRSDLADILGFFPSFLDSLEQFQGHFCKFPHNRDIFAVSAPLNGLSAIFRTAEGPPCASALFGNFSAISNPSGAFLHFSPQTGGISAIFCSSRSLHVISHKPGAFVQFSGQRGHFWNFPPTRGISVIFTLTGAFLQFSDYRGSFLQFFLKRGSTISAPSGGISTIFPQTRVYSQFSLTTGIFLKFSLLRDSLEVWEAPEPRGGRGESA
ncbi:hypothetical protein Taro_040132 [Colocasia esculenta]|uniref:Uncharacterized protein n=1 Tax=Colocasia esculenta TaxID=4460 RepID=A0A843WS53_COLES|nr:hypothetical protein [Colocasia esculenta]